MRERGGASGLDSSARNIYKLELDLLLIVSSKRPTRFNEKCSNQCNEFHLGLRPIVTKLVYPSDILSKVKISSGTCHYAKKINSFSETDC